MYINHNNSYCHIIPVEDPVDQAIHSTVGMCQCAGPHVCGRRHFRLCILGSILVFTSRMIKDLQGSRAVYPSVGMGCIGHRLQWASDMGQTSPKWCRWAGGSGNALLLDKTLLFVILLAVLFNYISCIPVWLFIYIYDRRKFRSQTSDNMDRWKAEMGRVREEKRRRKKIKKRESFRRKKIQVREKVGKSRRTVFFQWFVAPEGRKVGSLKRRVRSQLARWEIKIARRCGAKHISKSKWFNIWKAPHARTTFGRSDDFRCRFAWQAQGIVHSVKSEQNVRVL